MLQGERQLGRQVGGPNRWRSDGRHHAIRRLGLNAKGAYQGQALDQFREIPGRRRIRSLPQPRQRAVSAADANLEQLIQGSALLLSQTAGELAPELALRPSSRSSRWCRAVRRETFTERVGAM